MKTAKVPITSHFMSLVIACALHGANNSFKPSPLRGLGAAFGGTQRAGLTQALCLTRPHLSHPLNHVERKEHVLLNLIGVRIAVLIVTD